VIKKKKRNMPPPQRIVCLSAILFVACISLGILYSYLLSTECTFWGVSNSTAEFDYSRPRCIFLVGAEGTGHHLFLSLFKNMPAIRRTSRRIDTTLQAMYLPNVPPDEFERKHLLLRDELTTIYTEMTEKNMTHMLLCANMAQSFPYNRPEDATRRPDIHNLLSLLLETGYNVKLLVLVRDEIEAVNSVFKRKFSSNHRTCSGR
jgi:hypothetical protein